MRCTKVCVAYRFDLSLVTLINHYAAGTIYVVAHPVFGVRLGTVNVGLEV
jgi:hypothetical protein